MEIKLKIWIKIPRFIQDLSPPAQPSEMFVENWCALSTTNFTLPNIRSLNKEEQEFILHGVKQGIGNAGHI